MQKVKDVLLILSIIINIVLGYKLCTRETISKDYTKTIDTLDVKLSSTKEKKDSVNREIDTIFINLENVRKDYEKKHSIIVNNSIYDDYLFFSNYIEHCRERYDSINNH